MSSSKGRKNASRSSVRATTGTPTLFEETPHSSDAANRRRTRQQNKHSTPLWSEEAAPLQQSSQNSDNDDASESDEETDLTVADLRSRTHRASASENARTAIVECALRRAVEDDKEGTITPEQLRDPLHCACHLAHCTICRVENSVEVFELRVYFTLLRKYGLSTRSLLKSMDRNTVKVLLCRQPREFLVVSIAHVCAANQLGAASSQRSSDELDNKYDFLHELFSSRWALSAWLPIALETVCSKFEHELCNHRKEYAHVSSKKNRTDECVHLFVRNLLSALKKTCMLTDDVQSNWRALHIDQNSATCCTNKRRNSLPAANNTYFVSCIALLLLCSLSAVALSFCLFFV